MKSLGKMLADTFRQPAIKKDPFRKSREESRCLAAARGFEIEKMKDGGFNVWPPTDLAGEDQFSGDHYCNDWDEVVAMARVYALSGRVAK